MSRGNKETLEQRAKRIREQQKELARIDKEAKANNMTYGQYIAFLESKGRVNYGRRA